MSAAFQGFIGPNGLRVTATAPTHYHRGLPAVVVGGFDCISRVLAAGAGSTAGGIPTNAGGTAICVISTNPAIAATMQGGATLDSITQIRVGVGPAVVYHQGIPFNAGGEVVFETL